MRLALLLGHCDAGRGASTADGIHEREVIDEIGAVVRAMWASKAMAGLVVIQERDGLVDENHAILDRIEQANAFGADVSVELHFNAFNKKDAYALTRYSGNSSVARLLSAALAGGLKSFLFAQGATSFIEVPYPSEKWPGRKGAIADARCPAVILEPLFIDCPAHHGFFADVTKQREFGRLFAQVLEDFAAVDRGKKSER